MDTVTLTRKGGRIIYGLPFIIFGLFHFMNTSQIAGMISSLPGAEFLVYLSGAGLFLGGLAIVLNKFTHLVGLLLALELLLFILFVHLPGIMNAADEMAKQMYMTNFLKDFALMGGALMVSGMSKTS